jgi:cytidine deaminase
MNALQSTRIALFGLPGAGKSTSAAILRRVLEADEKRVAVVKIAAPLYDVQHRFYERAAAPLVAGKQDGKLLNFLGSHFRDVLPGFLLADFAERCDLAALSGANVIVCDDARPVDLKDLSAQGFTIVRITAPDELRRARKAGRDDVTTGRDDHPTEAGSDVAVADYTVNNNGGLPELEARIRDLAAACLDGSARQGAAETLPVAGDGRLLASLIERADSVISPCYVENRHQIGALLIAGDGRIFSGVHLEAMVGRASICAEAVALGKACQVGARDLRIVLSVRHPKPSEAHRGIRLVPPCGLCRELLLDYGQDLRVVLETDGVPGLHSLAELLPHKYVGTKWGSRETAL